MKEVFFQIELDRIVAVMTSEERECLLYDYLSDFLKKVVQYRQLDNRSLVVICKSHIVNLRSQDDEKFLQWIAKHNSAMLANVTERLISCVRSDDYKFFEKTLFAIWLTGAPQFRSRDLTPIFTECGVSSTNLSKVLDDLILDNVIEERAPRKGAEKEFALTEDGEVKLKRLLPKSSLHSPIVPL